MSGDGLKVCVQYAVDDPGAPSVAFIERCAACVFTGVAGELVVRIVGEPESALLNARYRYKQGATNVLAFPPGAPPPAAPSSAAGEPAALGDIVICAAVVAREAAEQGKVAEAHWAHLVVHGCLHLRGYDHMTDTEAASMEARERELLADLGIADPYAVEA